MYRIIWLTGPSGAGKTTLSKALREKWPCICLDGDEMRESISFGAGFSREDRSAHNLRVARLAHVLSRQMNVLVSVIAPIEDVRRQIDQVCHPSWVFVKRTMPVRENHFYEEPEGYFVLDHDNLSICDSVEALKEHLGIQHYWSE